MAHRGKRMASEKLSMRKLTEILRLRFEAKLSHRAIARSVDIGLGTVSLYLKRFQARGLS